MISTDLISAYSKMTFLFAILGKLHFVVAPVIVTIVLLVIIDLKKQTNVITKSIKGKEQAWKMNLGFYVCEFPSPSPTIFFVFIEMAL